MTPSETRLHVGISAALVLATALAAPPAQAYTLDARAMARFDIGYARCEEQFPAMRGHRDDAYLSLRRVKADEQLHAQLTAARKAAVYKSEQRRVRQAAANGMAPAASSPIDQQCQALWAETQRVMRAPH
ncbi:hypothetical protein [Methylibium sp.]|uniref:hypothetical protein n=1 Tax=Methylibium sp. TaxID=2067992 RepID=UPI003D0D825F